jgi:hypothetical protein
MRCSILLVVLATAASALPWPHLPQDSVHPIGRAWGNYQNYG